MALTLMVSRPNCWVERAFFVSERGCLGGGGRWLLLERCHQDVWEAIVAMHRAARGPNSQLDGWGL